MAGATGTLLVSNFIGSVGFVTLADTFVTRRYDAFASPGYEDCRVEVDTIPMRSL